MKKRIITASAALFLLVGAVLLIAPRISNHIGKEEAHSAIEQFEELKGGIEQTNPATEPTNAAKKHDETNATAQHSEERSADDYRSDDENYSAEYHIDADRLYRDSVAYNEKLKTEQYDLLINETSYRQASLNLYDYGVPNNIYGYISASSIGMELPINIFDTDLTYSEDGASAIQIKIDYVLTFCETIKGSALTAKERSVIDRCTKIILPVSVQVAAFAACFSASYVVSSILSPQFPHRKNMMMLYSPSDSFRTERRVSSL